MQPWVRKENDHTYDNDDDNAIGIIDDTINFNNTSKMRHKLLKKNKIDGKWKKLAVVDWRTKHVIIHLIASGLSPAHN